MNDKLNNKPLTQYVYIGWLKNSQTNIYTEQQIIYYDITLVYFLFIYQLIVEICVVFF